MNGTRSRLATRRGMLVGIAACATLAPAAASTGNPLEGLEHKHGGRLGVLALDTGSGAVLAYRADERFLMCSTFKLLAAAAVLRRVDAGAEHLDRRLRYTDADLLDHAPVTRAHLADGALSIGALCEAVVEVSDNTAANLLLAALGGPQAVTRFARSLGDQVTRLDRDELTLNTADGIVDTTTPRAMAGSMRAVLLGDALSPASRTRLEAWMVAATPGLKRIRAGIPPSWRAGDKSGTSDVQTNDLAILRPPARAPLIVTAFYAAPSLNTETREAELRNVGVTVVSWANEPSR